MNKIKLFKRLALDLAMIYASIILYPSIINVGMVCKDERGAV